MSHSMMGFQNSFSGGMVDAGVPRQLGNQMCWNKTQSCRRSENFPGVGLR